jgi:dephospho-CoA kinase
MSNNKRNAVVLGLTGGIASGKSEAGRILGEMGFAVCDADRVAHDLMKKGTPVFRHVIDLFGNDILTDDGDISRPMLGGIVFENPDRLQLLNQLVHPAVRDWIEQWIIMKRTAEKDAAVMIPLLFESGMQDLGWDAILCISSGEADVIERLNTRGLSREDAKKRISSQMPTAEKEKLADYVVRNHGTRGELEAVIQETIKAIRG